MLSSSNLPGNFYFSSYSGTTCETNLFPFSSGNVGQWKLLCWPGGQAGPEARWAALFLRGNLRRHQSGICDCAGIREPRGHSRALPDGRLPLPSEEGLDRGLGSVRSTSATYSITKATGWTPITTLIWRFKDADRRSINLLPYEEMRERLRPQDFLFLGLSANQNQDYHEHRSGASFQTGYFPKVTVGANYYWGDGVNFVPAATAAPQSLLSRLDTARRR